MRTPASEVVRCARALVGGETRHDYAFVVREGTIDYAGDYAIVREHADGLPVRSFPDDRLIVPGFINGHSHAYQILLRGWADDWTFARWRSDALYKVVPQLTPDDVHWIFIAAFSEMLAAGITTRCGVLLSQRCTVTRTPRQRSRLRKRRESAWCSRGRGWTRSTRRRQFRETIDLAQSRTLDLMRALSSGERVRRAALAARRLARYDSRCRGFRARRTIVCCTSTSPRRHTKASRRSRVSVRRRSCCSNNSVRWTRVPWRSTRSTLRKKRSACWPSAARA